MSLSNKELLQKIKDQVAQEERCTGWKHLSHKYSGSIDTYYWPIVCERFATEKAKEVLNFPENKNEQINYFLVNILRHLDAEQALTLAKNLIGRIPQTEYFTRSEVQASCEATLKKASENAKVQREQMINWDTKEKTIYSELYWSTKDEYYQVDKSSITDTKNIVIL